MIKKTSSALRLLSSQLKNTRVFIRPRVLLNAFEENQWTSFENQPRFLFSEENKDLKANDQQAKSTTGPEVIEEDVKKQIDNWVKENKCLLFMKGVPQGPRCGYSKFVVEVLRFYKVKDYHAVDVLKSQELRDSIKSYSNWPTFPQLYIDGKLIGGSDIVNEMHKEGSLKKLLAEHNLISA